MRRALLPAALLLASVALPAAAAAQATLSARAEGGAWRPFWRADAAPVRWTAPHPAVARSVRWTAVRPGLERGELRLAGSGEAWRVRVVLARLDPARFRLALRHAESEDGMAGAWTVDAADDAAALAFNAGQFSGGRPWGWVVDGGREVRPPGRGPLSAAVVVDTAGRVRWVGADGVEAVRRAGGIETAFQSYPTLLVGEGEVPAQLRAAGRGIDLSHRDSRLALCLLRDGRVLVALTRFDGAGGLLSAAPFGLTVPEMAALTGALGCRRALLLDGGISGQMLLRTASGRVERYPAWRRVPLGVVAVPRAGR